LKSFQFGRVDALVAQDQADRLAEFEAADS